MLKTLIRKVDKIQIQIDNFSKERESKERVSENAKHKNTI